ncbi:peptide chain release factor N(5)-glutamine methyltransferase [Ferrimonas balearica]|uniref:peptide chain release factor N(5)-glutamine methyltransferase n=1 Tax=Ferrimonas balearica TaxID=44012 RepID=UPI001C99BE2B|nr:peptide chain release factor N(5)-glutamine methyltransferase [Ferrimonas balearica]MBY5921921.1 peptide chain release factor N(5)-glutamine methyltransferase [Ferrimonas balearica]MBY5994739.1 peptide chain release factor N(5)-glutamine methyltransferase [Ferrimonas balearica]
MRLDAWLSQASTRLEGRSESPRLDAELLLLSRLGKPRSFLFSWPEHELPPALVANLEGLLARREAGEPVAHLTGQREFWSLPLKVNATTLIPRPDTEALVEAALGLGLPEQAEVVDLGTGTGAIALALKSEQPSWQISAVDRIADAAALAQANSAALDLPIRVYEGSWFEPLSGQRFDLVISNPPYIDPDDPHLEQGDVRFEPRSALTAEEQGLADIRYLASAAQSHLKPGGVLMVEHGWDQGEAVRAIFNQAGLKRVETGRDLGQRERFTLGFLAGNE